jgi:hypothetical protein
MTRFIGPVRSRIRRVLVIGFLGLAAAGCGGSVAASPTGTGLVDAPTEAEATLLAGMRLDLEGACQPLRRELPANAIAGLECRSQDVGVSGARIYLFNRQEELLEAYLVILEAHGVTPRVQADGLPFGESSYVPGDDPAGPLAATRHGHWVDEGGKGHYLATEPPFVLIAVDGTNANVELLYGWAWRGNEDVPGAPTLWRESGPADPNAKG